MITTTQAPFREPEDKTLKWVMIFIVVSLLLHALLFTGIVLISRLVPTPKFVTPEPPKENKIALSIIQPPPAPKPIFIPTQPQLNTPHVKQQVESANDTVKQSRAKTAHNPDSIMPEIEGKQHAPDMHNSPQVKAPKTPQPSTTPPTPRAQPQKPSPTPAPQVAQQVQPRPMPPRPPKPAPPKPTPPQEQVDPLTGLPVLAPIAAPTMAPRNQTQPLAPAPSQKAEAGSVHGSLGRAGDNSPAAMQTDLGKYKQYVYEVVGSYWYPQIDQKFGTIGVGSVHIQFTIHKDGTLSDVQVLDGDNSNLLILRDVSLNSLRSPAPFKPFSPSMIKEVGDSYTDDFSFSVY
ncbi:MAG TPA: hypothetical protein VHY09_10320 [Candidatus Methylacidiphilales bacterium]|nr:hypothetical protein [Candidatus Methylacidiphilales bacterium]